MIYLQKGEKKLDENSIFWENCMILKNLSLGKQPYNGPCYRRKRPGIYNRLGLSVINFPSTL
jgi:hypothetical protein